MIRLRRPTPADLVALRARLAAAALRAKHVTLGSLRAAGRTLLANASEILLVVGWLLITAGIAHLTSRVAWYFSLGLLALSLGGLKVVIGIAWHGIDGLGPEAPRG